MIQLEKLFNRAENLIEREDLAFEDTVKKIISLSYGIMVRDNDFIIDSFISLTKNPDDYGDKANFYRFMQAGKNAIEQKNFTELRKVVSGLYSIGGRKENEFLTANIIKG